MPPIYPPILANVCLTRLKPFKDAAHARTESERIGNNYSKYAKDLKLTHKKSSTRRNASLRQVFNFASKARPLIGWQRHNFDWLKICWRKSIKLQDLETDANFVETESRPSSPISQRNMLLEPFEEPSDTDLERFQRFTGMIKDADLEPLHQESLNSIWNRSPYHDQFTDLKNELKDEINSSQGFTDSSMNPPRSSNG